MIYLDYSATTPINKDVLDTFVKVSNNYIGNANSLHKLGVESKTVIDRATKVISDSLKINDFNIIYTSGATEANNFCLKGICDTYKNRGKHIITTKLEHSSILETINYLESIGYEISYVNVLDNGMVDIEDLKRLIRKDTILVSICHVNSEVGYIQDIENIGKVIKDINPLTYFHSDGTQAIGKIKVSFNNVDFYSFSGHKIYGPVGIGVLLKRKNINILPLINGGKSTTIYRSGTPATALIASLAKSIKISIDNLDDNYKRIGKLNKYLIDKLKNITGIVINSNQNTVNNIINISLYNIKSETMLHYLETNDIYISTKTACSKDNSSSLTLLTVGKEELAKTSIRISISYLTTKSELDQFIDIFTKGIKELNLKG